MSNPKTSSSLKPAPEMRNGWVRKCDLDDYLGRYLPVPTQVVSNEEFYPLPQTPKQQAVERLVVALSDHNAKRLGVSRRQFLRTSCGMATAFAAMNTVFGNFFKVDAAELLEPAAVQANKTRYFIFDVQTHHVDAGARFQYAQEFLEFRQLARRWNPAMPKREPQLPDLYLENYIKEVFLDSDTDIAVITGLPSPDDRTNILTPSQMVKTRLLVNDLAHSRRVVSHGLITPDLGAQNLESMHAQVEKLHVEAWKGYTGVACVPGGQGWWLDDEKVAYPTLELARQLKVKNVCLHKGLPFLNFNVEHCKPQDVPKAALDFPDLNFLIYHSGFKSLEEGLLAAETDFKLTSYVPWVSDLCEARKKHPRMTNVYMELGSTFGQMVITSPLLCGHVLGMIIDAFGVDHVLWGTDSIWWGSPQWQIEAMRRFEMPEQLMRQFGYKPLTAEVKRRIFGLNGAHLYGVDPEAKRNPIPGDYIDQLKELYKRAGNPLPSHTQYGWVAG